MNVLKIAKWRFYERINLLKEEVTGSIKSDEKVIEAWQLAIKFAQPGAGGAPDDARYVNMAMLFLLMEGLRY